MIYLDNAATSFPKPPCVTEEICRCIKKYCGNPGRSSHALSIKSAEKIFETRELLADLFGAKAENVVFTYNTTYALNIAIKSHIKLSSHILISDMEHNSVLRPVHELSRLKLCTYDIFSSEGDEDCVIENLKSKLKPNTSMIICTQSSNICSRKLPIKKIGNFCKEHGIYFIVDGAQSAGLYEINVQKMNIDALCVPAHKSLYGPQGLGMIIFGNDLVGRSIIEGGTGINSLELNMPDVLPEAYESGTQSTPLIAGLSEAIKWLKAIECAKIRKYEEELYSCIKDLLSDNEVFDVYLGDSCLGNTLLFNIKGISPTFVSSELDKRGICTRSGLHCAPLAHRTLNVPPQGAIRIGIGVYNTRSDMLTLYDALLDIISSQKK